MTNNPRGDPESVRVPTRRGISTRRAIIDATIASLVRSGVGGTTVERVMAQAGVSRGSVLHQFATRNDLLIAVAEHAMLAVMARSRRLAAAIDDPAERLADYARIVWESHSHRDGLALTELLQASRWDVALAEGLRPVARRIERDARDELVALADAAGVAEPEMLVPRGWMLLATARGLIIELGVEARRPMIRAAVDEMMRSHRRYCAWLSAGMPADRLTPD